MHGLQKCLSQLISFLRQQYVKLWLLQTKQIRNVLPPPHHNGFMVLFPGPPGEPVPEENFWTLWCKGRLTEADTPTIRVGATPSGLITAHSTIPHMFYRPDALSAAQPTASKH